MGRERPNQIKLGLERCFFRMRKARDGKSSMNTHRRIYISARSTLPRQNRQMAEYTYRMRQRVHFSVPLNHTASCGMSLAVVVLSPFQVKS